MSPFVSEFSVTCLHEMLTTFLVMVTCMSTWFLGPRFH